MRSENSRVGTALEMIEAGYAMLSDEALDTQTLLDLLAVQSRLEALSWKAPAIAHKLIARLRAEADPKALGAKNLADLLATRLRISVADANQRIKHATLLGPRQSMTGEPLAPALPNVAAGQAAKTAAPNGSPHPTSTPAKPASTTTTTPRNT